MPETGGDVGREIPQIRLNVKPAVDYAKRAIGHHRWVKNGQLCVTGDL